MLFGGGNMKEWKAGGWSVSRRGSENAKWGLVMNLYICQRGTD